MALTAQVAGVLVLLALVNGQFNPTNVAPGCSDPRVQAGHGYISHQTYCQKFYQCDTALNRYEKTCPEDLLFNSNLSVCVAPEAAPCSSWRCDSTTIGTTYPNICCNKFYRCTGSGFELVECENGESYNMASGQCQRGFQCTPADSCRTNFPGQGNEPYRCFDKPNPNGNPCQYLTEYTTIKIEDRPCPHGTSFNETSCMCSILNTNCPKNLGLAEAKVLDPACRPSMDLQLGSLPLRATSPKMPSGMEILPYEFQSIGVSLNNNQLSFNADPILGTSYLYSYYFNANQLGMPLALSVVFRVDSGTNSLSFNLLTNNFNGACSGEETLTVSVNYNNGAYDVNVMAIGVTTTGATSEISNTGTTQANINANGFVELRLFFDGAVSGQLINKGANGNTQGNSVDFPPTSNLGAYLANNKCGFAIGEGLNGQISKFVAYEGCGDFSLVV